MGKAETAGGFGVIPTNRLREQTWQTIWALTNDSQTAITTARKSTGNTAATRATHRARVQACKELGVEHEARTVTKPFSA